MQKEAWRWNSTLVSGPGRVVRWGHFGAPVLIFPSAGGDCEEIERYQLIHAMRELIEHGRIKVYSVDGLAARAWLCGTYTPDQCARAQAAYDAFIHDEVVPIIRRDCQSDSIEILTAGVALGGCAAVTSLCAHPSVFRKAIAISGIFDLSKYVRGGLTPELRRVLPVHYVQDLAEGVQLDTLRRRLVLLATGEGEYESPEESERLAGVLLARGVPCHLELLGPEHAHSWNTWRKVLPRYLAAHA
ncbi:MAG: hypothetical protein IRZ28_07550 [Steroidobacteraceae bacterium]|nr:hypothetical protein [Steroidobacteraceae bacterium]